MGGPGQAHPPGTDTKDTLNSRIVPIIFVPGVMGTRLSISGASQDWDPDDPLEMSNMAPMVIRKVDGDGTVPLASSRFDGASGPGRPLGRDGFGVEHAECFGNQDFRKGVIERIRKLLKP